MDTLPLFSGKKIILTAWTEEDAEAEARWSEDPAYLSLIQSEPPRPLSLAQARKKNRPAEDAHDAFVFSIREQKSSRVLGIVSIRNIQWNHSLGDLFLTIGDAAERRQGYGSDALDLVLRFAFHELNLDHLLATVFEFNFPARQFFEKAGFTEEVRMREALLRFGRRWDRLILGLEKSTWESRQRQFEGERDYVG